MKGIRIAAGALSLAILLMAGVARAGAPPDVAEAIARAKAAWDQVDDYTCLLHRQERHGGRIYRQKGIRVKFRKPYSVYMKWTEGGMAGTEALFVRGRNDGKMIAHKGGFLGFLTFRMEPRDPRAMKENRHPIDESSLGDLLGTVARNHEESRKAGEGKWTYGGEETLGDRPAAVYSAKLPPGRGYYARGIVLHFDRENGLPVRVAAYDGEGLLLEEYWFDALRLNVGLGDRDFDPDNPEYRF